jgi:hypothetical protein
MQSQDLKPEVFYKRDMLITVNGLSAEGALVAPASDKYEVHVEARGDLDLFVMRSCHKEESKEKAWNVKTKVKSGLFGWGSKIIDQKREVNFTLYLNELEKEDCPIELGGFEQNGGRHSWGVIDFESPKYQVKAAVLCNGNEVQANGNFICQSRNGLFQKIKFASPMKVAPSNSCGFIGEGLEFETKLPLGSCVAIFKGDNKLFKFSGIGYEAILIRE